MCVTKLKNSNKISVNVEGYSVCTLLDTGSTINLEQYNKIKQTTELVVKICEKQCTLVEGSTEKCKKIIDLYQTFLFYPKLLRRLFLFVF